MRDAADAHPGRGSPREPGQDLAPGIRLLEAEKRFPSSNSLLLEGDDETVLVDAGLAPERLEALAPSLDRAVVTHFHLDHAQGIPHLAGVPVTVNGAETPAFEGDVAALADFLELGHPWRDRFVAEFADGFPDLDAPDATFEPGDPLDLAGSRWETIRAPGHSPGHVMLWAPGERVLFSVDVDFRGWGPWYGWPHCDPTAFEAATEAARDRFAEADVVATSHSDPVPDGDEALAAVDAFVDVFEERDQAVLDVLGERGHEGATLPELVEGARIFYGEHLGSRPWHEYWCRVMTGFHLERLEARDEVVADGAVWRRA
jgi:glyoxylase-like metal-dependent hydrolase (beta-lactamase superfamily II)